MAKQLLTIAQAATAFGVDKEELKSHLTGNGIEFKGNAKLSEEAMDALEAAFTYVPEDEGEAKAPAKTSNLRQYDKWIVEPQKEQRADPRERGKQITVITGYLAIKAMRTKVKIEPQLAINLNAQSHNNGFRYYPTGTVTNGDVETVEIEHNI